MFAASHDTNTDAAHTDAIERRRVRAGFALSHPTVVAGLAFGADVPAAIVGVALLALHGLVELHWHAADRNAGPAGVPAAALYSGPS